jgi:hypothetical protein
MSESEKQPKLFRIVICCSTALIERPGFYCVGLRYRVIQVDESYVVLPDHIGLRHVTLSYVIPVSECVLISSDVSFVTLASLSSFM